MGWPKGKRRSEETKRKISVALKGRRFSEETKRKMSNANTGKNNPMYGKKLSEETKRKMSEAHMGEKNHFYGKKHTEESKRKMSEGNKGKTHSEESKLKMSEARKGNKNSFYGRHHSEESKRKISEANKGERCTKETRAKLRAARLKQIIPTKDTSIEVALQAELDRRDAIYDRHVPVCGICQPDIVFSDKMVAVFADGDYWHSKEFDDGKRWENDRRQDKVLRENGWAVIRFWESEINDNASLCVDIVETALGCFGGAQ